MLKINSPYFKKVNSSGRLLIFCVLAIAIILLSFSVTGEASPKFLIFHLDAVSSQNFFQYMEDGDLPNIKAFFEDGHMIHHGLSLFPGGTENAVPHMKEGSDNSTGGVGWGYYDRDKEKVIPSYKTFFHLFSCIPRRAKACFIYGVPGLDPFMSLPLLNIPELLETYGVIQFFWFTTDSLGHLMGPKLYEASIRRFDRYFGALIKRLNFDELNIIIYCDHGMSFGRFINADQREEVKRIVGNDLKVFIHPNVYLKYPDKKGKVARDIVLESEIDFAFYRDNPHRVVGYFDQGKMIFEEKEERLRYLFEGEDALDYYSAGYKGEWLTDLEWLSQTRDSKFPGVPPNIYNLLSNEKVGDIVIVINPPKIPIFWLRYPANHAGLTNTDLMMPILLRGEQLKHLYSREEMWLHNLYTSIPELSFENLEPAREKNSFSFWGSGYGEHNLGFEMFLSPAYRWKFGFHYYDNIYRSWLEYDLYSSYLMRLWAGTGLQYNGQNLDALVQARLQIDLGKIQLNYGGQFTQEGWEINTKELVYQINDCLALEWLIPNRFGMSFSW
ncbi:MAG: alkaline phosphatase family protein [Candidatus Caldatribacteriota bacterium]|nr:alkaline phosphatase family protein [Candidatus Caldatribacteriota bacterium]